MNLAIGDRVKWKPEYDPMTAFNSAHGFTSPVGTIDEIADGVACVIWDASEGEAQGNMPPHPFEELEILPKGAPPS